MIGTSFSRIEPIVEKLRRWRDAERDPQFDIDVGIGHSANYDLPTLVALERVRQSLGPARNGVPRSIYLGGLHVRSAQQMSAWLQERRDQAGIQAVHASFAGHGAMHDRWNGRVGDFGFLMQTLRCAADVGLILRQRLFVVVSTLPLLDELIVRLDTLPGTPQRYFSQFFYRGSAIEMEEERITEEMRDLLPGYMRAAEVAEWHSEREWLEMIHGRRDVQESGYLKLHVTRTNLEGLEARSAEEIVADLQSKTQAAYDALPPRHELAERYGDPHNRRLYSSLSDLECKWLDKHLAEHPAAAQRHLTHLWKEFWN